jgi:hypothetical protein
MTTSTTMTRPSLKTADLVTSGFAIEQIVRLIELREAYSPFREQFNEREYQQLNFLRWRIARSLTRADHELD